MNDKLFQNILYFIVATILLTLSVQVYWNFKNYEKNLQNFQNDVQISLDNALENYYSKLAENNHMTFINLDEKDNSPENVMNMLESYKMDSISKKFDEEYGKSYDSITQIIKIGDEERALTYSKNSSKLTNLKIIRGKKAADSIKLIKNITSIFISIQDDSLKLNKLSPLIKEELNRKQINIPFALKFKGKDSIKTQINTEYIEDDFFKTNAKSKFLKENESLTMYYPNAKSVVLSEGLSGIIISLFLVAGIIGCLFYLLKIIKHQKQLAEVKNDLISNITHEFKTPIATISVALESIKNFNTKNDPEKTKTYLEMSSNQLDKLNVMVEKLLETATLDSENLELNKESCNIIELLDSLVTKYQMQTEDKAITIIKPEQTVYAQVDIFHFENAISNIMDNALKYGGTNISVELIQTYVSFSITITDDGNKLDKHLKDKIFEKFYRVPKGNTHDIKGFGIGLYYTKKIIEKHGGAITVSIESGKTSFKISLPNE